MAVFSWKRLTSDPKWWAIPAAIALFLVYLNHFDNAFHFDDSHTIVNNKFITEIENIPLFFKDAKTTSSLPTNQAYRPVITSLNAIDYWIGGGLKPVVFHTHIFLEYLVLLVLLYFVFLRLMRYATGNDHRWVAFFAVLFFAFHTASAETINYVIARSDGFSTLMVLAALLLYMRHQNWKRYLGLIPFIIGCLAKPTTLMLAPILFLYEWMLRPPAALVPSRDTLLFLKKGVPSLVATLPYFAVGAFLYFFTKSMFSDTWVPSHIKMVYYLQTQPYVISYYLKTFLLPNHLTADSDMEVIKRFWDFRVIGGLLLIAATLAFAFVMAMRRKTLPVAFGIFWFYVALVPSSSVIPLGEVMNNHRTFFPYIGLVLALSWLVYLGYEWLYPKVENRKVFDRSVVGVILFVIALHAFGTWQRNEIWDNDESLWRDVTMKSPNNGRGLMNYGLTRMGKGDYEGAMDYFERAFKTSYGSHPYLYLNYAVAKNATGLTDEAEKLFQTAVRLGPGYPETHFHYGKFLMEQKRIPEAVEKFRKTVELSPAHVNANLLLNALTASGETVTTNLEKVAELDPTPENLLNLSLHYYRNKRYEDCISAAQRALELKPDYAEAYNNICSAYNNLKQWDAAMAACGKALAINPEYTLARNNLEWAVRKKAETTGQ